MKKLVLLTFLSMFLLSFTMFGQSPIKFRLSANVQGDATDTIKYNKDGSLLKKGQQFVMWIAAAGNSNNTTRQILADFQYDNSALTLVSIGNTGTGGNGGILPQNSNAQESFYEYPGYTYNKTTQNTTSNGTTNYQNATYAYTSGGPSTIVRYNLTWSGSAAMPYSGYWSMIKVVFAVKQNMTGFVMNPVQLNFVAAWTATGAYDATTQESPLKETVYLNPNADSYVNASVDVNSNLTAIAPLKISFYDTTAKMGYLFDVTTTGAVNVDQTRLKANTVYRVQSMLSMDKLYDIYGAAMTVSDFTGPQNEFVSTNLDGTPANINMTTGAAYLAADMNNDKLFNGADLPMLLARAVGQDTIMKLPAQYTAGTGGYISTWTFRDTAFNNMSTTSWKTADLSGIYFKTGAIGDYLPLNLKYLLWGDVNRSHSSQVVRSNSVITSALPSFRTSGYGNITTNAVAANATVLINTTQEIPSIDVSLNNTVVTSDKVTIPVTVDTKGIDISALQFEFQFDPTKIKFEELALGLPNTWYSFVTSSPGKIKFGALDRSLTTSPLKGAAVPFTLKFSTLVPGVDILTSVKVTSVMDASDTKGNQVGINLNTTTIKLTGYNNF